VSDLVLDASAALALLGTDGRTSVSGVLRDRIQAGDRILVSPMFWTQVIDSLAEQQPPDAIVEAVYELEQLGLETAGVGRPGVLATVDGVGRGLDAHDAATLALAESAEARLLTASSALAAVAAERAILVGGGRRARAPRAHRSWTRWKGAAAYLRQLRATVDRP
jgi:predicted nucleic acid-binding protein